MRTGVRPPQPGRVPVLTVLPADPERMAIGGIASFVRGFVKFAPDDFDLAFLGVSASREPWRWERVTLEGRAVDALPVVRVESARRTRVPVALRFVAALRARSRARRGLLRPGDYVTGFHRPATDLGLGGWSGPRWRVVHLSISDLATSGSESRWRRGAGLLTALEHRSFRAMDRIYVVNRLVADRYRREFPDVAERIQFIPNWADPMIFRRFDADVRHRLRNELGRALGLPDEATTVLFAGRLEGQKDPLLLARAFARLRLTTPTAHLLVTGDGSLRDSMREELARAGALDAARFLGIVSRERLAELMNASDALAITSAFETGPTVGLEALACGLPVVTTPVGEVARLVAETGAGIATADRSVEALAGALAGVLDAPASRAPAAVTAAAPFLADRVLGPFYDENRRLAERLAREARAGPPPRPWPMAGRVRRP